MVSSFGVFGVFGCFLCPQWQSLACLSLTELCCFWKGPVFVVGLGLRRTLRLQIRKTRRLKLQRPNRNPTESLPAQLSHRAGSLPRHAHSGMLLFLQLRSLGSFPGNMRLFGWYGMQFSSSAGLGGCSIFVGY